MQLAGVGGLQQLHLAPGGFWKLLTLIRVTARRFTGCCPLPGLRHPPLRRLLRTANILLARIRL